MEEEAEPQQVTLIFVYGTLRRGEANHALLRRATYLGEARTLPSYDLFDFGEYPGMVAGGSCSVVGEVYAVTPATLRRLDELEQHPTWYLRHHIELWDGRKVETYLLPAAYCSGVPRISSGDWVKRSAGET